jgi:hypothetical protein
MHEPPRERSEQRAALLRDARRALDSCSALLGRMRAEELVARYDSAPHHPLAVILEAEPLVHAAEAVPKCLAVEA